MDTFRISSTGLSLNYLPQYLAEQKGFFRDVDLELETVVPVTWSSVINDILSGKSDAVCGGIWVPSMYISHHVQSYKAFAQISSKCPYKLVSRHPANSFSWKELEDKIVLVPCDGGASAYIYLAGVLRDESVAVDRVRFIHDFRSDMLIDCFGKGTFGDYLFLPAVEADKLESSGVAFIVAEMVNRNLPVPWSVYYSLPETADRKDRLVFRFAEGLRKGLVWVNDHKAESYRSIIQEIWKTDKVDRLIESIETFKEKGMWDRDVDINREAYLHYARYQIDAGVIDNPVPYEQIVISKNS